MEEFLDLVEECADTWQALGNQETEWIGVVLYEDPPPEFIEFEERCIADGVCTDLMNYGVGCELLEIFVRGYRGGVHPCDTPEYEELMLKRRSLRYRHG